MTRLHARHLNALALLGCSAILVVAFGYQFALGELPCPLCLLQRAAFAAAGLGFALSVRFGPRPSHYGVVILSALAGAAVAGRQVALHVVPGTGGYGSTLMVRACPATARWRSIRTSSNSRAMTTGR